MGRYSVVGTRVTRVDAAMKVTGQAKFALDLKLPGMLYAKVLRSPLPHAKILHIDTGRVQQLRGVRAVITADDTPKIRFSTTPYGAFADRLILADKKVRFIGEAVAAVAAINEDTAEEALELIQVDYEELPAVFGAEEAMQPGAPLVHENIANNLLQHAQRHFGDIERGFAEAEHIFEDRFATQVQAHCKLEVHSRTALVGPDGRVTVWGTNGNVREGLALALNMSQADIRVMNDTYVGGSFGGRGFNDPEASMAALLSRKAARPVKLALTREEEFSVSGHRHPVVLVLKTGVKKDGTIVARHLRSIVNLGAYNRGGTITLSSTGYKTAQLYAVPNYKFDGYAVYTNNCVGAAFRGWGGPQAHFAMESQLDMIAERLGIDPLEIRLKNANKPGHLGASGALMSSVGLSDCLRQSAEAAGWQDKRRQGGSNRGIGMSSMIHAGGGAKFTTTSTNFSEAYLKMDPSGVVNILIGEAEVGVGAHTTLSMIAAEELGLPMDKIHIHCGDTDDPLSSYGTGASRVTFVAGSAVRAAAAEARKVLFQTAADLLEANPDDLEARDETIFVKGSPDKSVPIPKTVATTMARIGGALAVKGSFEDRISTGLDERGYGNYTPTYAFGCQVAEVEVDSETGQMRIINLVDSQDCGTVINPVGAETQMEGGATMGIGYGLMEQLVKDRGRCLNPNLADYKCPSALDVPPIKTILVDGYEPHGPFGAKALGEPTMVPTAAALANALYHATGLRVKELPLTPERILRAMKEKTS